MTEQGIILNKKPLRNLVVFVALALIMIGVQGGSEAASTSSLSIVSVGAPAINCVFDSDCTITVADTTSTVTIPGESGEGFLQSRTFPIGEAGTAAEGLFGYLYRIDLRDMTASGGNPLCVNDLTIDFGDHVSLDYSAGAEDVFVITSGGLGSVGLSSATRTGDEIRLSFSGDGVCPGDSSYFIGITSALAAQPLKGSLSGWNDVGLLDASIGVRVPQRIGEMLTLTPTLDTWVNTTPGADTPNSEGQLLWVGQDEFTYESYALLKFDLSALAGLEIISAELDLFHEASSSSTSLTHTICANKISSLWTANVTAATAPSISNTCYAATSVTSTSGSHVWNDVTALVQEWADTPAGNYGLALKQNPATYGYKAFQSMDGNVAPQLHVRYVGETALDEAVEAMNAASSIPLEITFDGRLPAHVAATIPVAANIASPVEQALLFADAYNDVYKLPDPLNTLYLDRIAEPGAGDGSHVFFKQRINDVPVLGATFSVHIEDGKVTSTSGRYLQEAPEFPKPALSAWDAEQYLLSKFSDDGIEITGETRPVIYNPSLLGGASDSSWLVWEVRVVSAEFSGSLLVNSMSADVFDEISDEHEARPGENFQISDHSARSWRDCDPDTIWFDASGDVGYTGDANNDGSDANDTLHTTYHYFYDQFGRRSWNNRGELLPVKIDASDITNNALFTGRCGHMAFGDNMVTLDIMAHEFVHGLDDRTADLRYRFQSGALDESFADVFGILVDADDWTIGEGSALGVMRDISDPPAQGDPDHMRNFLNVPEGTDNGGVHTNSGIPNKVAYLLIAGDTHNAILVDALGRDKVGRLYYDVLTNRLTSNAQFSDARNAMLDQALSYVRNGARYGFTTADVCAVRDAWASVGIGSTTDARCSAAVVFDSDADSVPDTRDNCLTVANPDQQDADRDGAGNACDSDDDNDDIPDTEDNCDFTPNEDQADINFDGEGDVCDDSDSDGVYDDTDNCRGTPNRDQANNDGDSAGDLCDSDDDNDGRSDWNDNCRFTPNIDQADDDGDGVGNACDTCVDDHDPSNADLDGDGIGDICDLDDDNDDIPDAEDNCNRTHNPYQFDLDGNGAGSLCDDGESLIFWELPQTFDLLFNNPELQTLIPLPRPNCLSCGEWVINRPDFNIAMQMPVGFNVRVVDNFGRTVTTVGAAGNPAFQLPVDPEVGFNNPFGGTRGVSSSVEDMRYFLEVTAPDDYDTNTPLTVSGTVNAAAPTVVSLSHASQLDTGSQQTAMVLVLLAMLSVGSIAMLRKQ